MLALSLLFAACDADCENSGRLNGSYAVLHTALNVVGEPGDTGDTGTDTGEDAGKATGGKLVGTPTEYDDVSYAVFVNGWSRWELTWAASSGQLKAKVRDAKERMGDPGEVSGLESTWSGELTAADDNCNAFQLKLRGQFTTPQETEHLFTYTADVVWQGDGLAGTFQYSDTFSGPTVAGGLANAQGEVVFVAQPAGGFDTGF